VLLSAIQQAIECSRAALRREAGMRSIRDSYASLSRRERQVMALVVRGLLNKQVGGELGISEITVKAHRGNMMRKMKANSLADLVNMAASLQLASTPKEPTQPSMGKSNRRSEISAGSNLVATSQAEHTCAPHPVAAG
jgi:DNA-binding CsgD family transcriptional regulator